MNKIEIIRALTGDRRQPVAASGHGRAPSNIALCKYWGKRDTELNLPVTSSLSISLGPLGTTTTIEPKDGSDDEVVLNGLPVPADTGFARRLRDFLDPFRPASGAGFRVVTANTIPTAAGLASSASGYAALVIALDSLFGWNLSRGDLSVLARLGSGSASRSVYHGFVEWHAGTRADGMDSRAEKLDARWPDLRIGLVKISVAEKAVSSRDAMKGTVDTSLLYRVWPEQVTRDLASLHGAIQRGDFEALGRTAENNALAMHATALAAWPPTLFWKAESVAAMHRVWALRQQGLPVYFTMDAGPNLKLIVENKNVREIQGEFPDAEWVAPFAETADVSVTA